MNQKNKLLKEISETYFIQCPFCDKQEESMIDESKAEFVENLIKDGWLLAPKNHYVVKEDMLSDYCCPVCAENAALQEKDTGRIIKNNSE